MKRKPVALLVTPPIYDFAYFDLFNRPFGILRVGGYLADNGFDVRYVNALDYTDRRSARILGIPSRRPNGTGKMFRQIVEKPTVLSHIKRNYSRYGITVEALKAKLTGIKPNIILIATSMTYWYPGVREVSDLVAYLYPNIPVVAGGGYATLQPNHCREVCHIPHIVQGSSIEQLDKVLEAYSLPNRQTHFSGIPLPLPEVWRDAGVLRLNEGCRLNCDYCASNLMHRQYVPGDADVAFRQFLSLHERCGTSNFAFYDDALLDSKQQVLVPFLERVLASGIRAQFYVPNAVHLGYLDLDTARIMRKIGFQEIRIGFESSSRQFHREHDNKVDVTEMPGAVADLKRGGFPGKNIVVYVLAGLPGQKSSEAEESIRFLAKLEVRISIAEFSPVPGTGLWDQSVQMSRYPIDEEPLFQNNSVFPLVSDCFTTEDLSRLKLKAREIGR